ncbi:MAG: AAA family ATPase [Candidatus Nanopelagicales bacterium]|nr:AAA family ATPase [Candidatus Nanopelagicales bacterium]MDZ4249266.1 AAA family ATPase [Candidatus Nanopelagicales bacterium]
MLVSFAVENFGAFRDRAILDLRVPASTDAPHGLTPFGEQVASVAVTYGANASGKTTLLEAIVRLQSAVAHSHRSWDPEGGTNARPFLLRAEAATHPTTWRITFVPSDGPPGQYEYTVTMDSSSVRSETLRHKSVSSRRSRWLFRRSDQDVMTTDRSVLSLQPKLRRNSLLLSVAAQENEQSLLPAFSWITKRLLTARRLGTPEGQSRALSQLVREEDLPLVKDLARSADLGIDEVRGTRLTTAQLDELRTTARRIQDALPGMNILPPAGEFAALTFGHTTARGETYYLPEAMESDGTMTYLAAGLLAERALRTGGVAVIDELDASLHPTLVEDLVALFRSSSTNPHGAQLIATTHDTHLFGRSSIEPLSRHEVWFTEKDTDGASTLFRLGDFPGVRPTVDQEHRYLVGRYGAVPSLHLPQRAESSGR